MGSMRESSKKSVGARRRFRRSDYSAEHTRVRCALCHQDFKAISISHVRVRHGIDLEEYMERFPRANLSSADTRQRLSNGVSAHYEVLGRYWTRKRIREELRRRGKDGRPLNARAVFLEDRALYEAAYSLFRSWDRALRASGFSPSEVRRYRRWTPQEVLREIRSLHADHQLVLGSRLIRRRPELAAAAAKHFGSWRAAVEKAGFRPLTRPAASWTRREVISRIRDRAKRGSALNSREVCKHETGLWRAAKRLFRKPWPQLIRSLGYQIPRRGAGSLR